MENECVCPRVSGDPYQRVSGLVTPEGSRTAEAHSDLLRLTILSPICSWVVARTIDRDWRCPAILPGSNDHRVGLGRARNSSGACLVDAPSFLDVSGADGRGGIRYLTSSIVIGFLYAGLVYRSWIRRIGFLLASAVVPILANGFRVYGIILLAYVSGNRIAAGVDHLLYGWLFFTIVMLLLLSVGFWWREKPQTVVDSLSVSTPKSPDLAQDHREGTELQTSAKRTALFATLFFLVIGLAPGSVRLFWSRPARMEPLNLAAPLASLPWRITSKDVYGWRPSFPASNAELIQSYQSPEQAVNLYLAYYAPGREDAKLVSSTNSLFDSKLWSRTGEEDAAVALGGQSFHVHETFIRSAQQSLVIWNWYWVDGKFTNDEYEAKYLLARARFSRSRQGAAAIALATEDPPGRQRAADVLKEFLNHIALQESLRSNGN
jgi:EpsI family protein